MKQTQVIYNFYYHRTNWWFNWPKK